jgi:hypothetical protein
MLIESGLRIYSLTNVQNVLFRAQYVNHTVITLTSPLIFILLFTFSFQVITLTNHYSLTTGTLTTGI